MSGTIRVVVVDDHPIFRSGLVQLLDIDERLEVVAQGDKSADAVTFADELRPDLLLLDVTMSQSGLDVIEDVLAASPNTRIVMLTASEQKSDVSRSLEAGAVGYVLKGTTGSELLTILHDIYSGHVHISPRAIGSLVSTIRTGAEKTATQLRLKDLSPQETNVLRLIGKGFNNREIGKELDIQEKTVKFHVSNIFNKMKVRNRVEAGLLAARFWPEADH